MSQTTANGGAAAYDFDVYDIRAPSNDPNPPETYASYLAQPSVTSKIGAKATYTECPEAPYDKFQTTGDGKPYFVLILSSKTKLINWKTPDLSCLS